MAQQTIGPQPTLRVFLPNALTDNRLHLQGTGTHRTMWLCSFWYEARPAWDWHKVFFFSAGTNAQGVRSDSPFPFWASDKPLWRQAFLRRRTFAICPDPRELVSLQVVLCKRKAFGKQCSRAIDSSQSCSQWINQSNVVGWRKHFGGGNKLSGNQEYPSHPL